MSRGDMMLGPGGVAKYPRSESVQLVKALELVDEIAGSQRNQEVREGLRRILSQLHGQVASGYHRNPSSSRTYEPFKIVGVIGTDVHTIAYRHVNGKPFKHDFQKGSAEVVAIERHGKRELLITSPDGVPLWNEF